jgi:hypothetical protein
MLKVRRCPHYFTSMINSHVAPQSTHINIVMMHNKDIVARIDRALSSDRMVSHQRSMGYIGNNPSTHGSELSVGHVLTLMSDCVPKEYTKSVDSIIDMGCGGGMMCVTLAMLFCYKKIIGIDSCESRINHLLELTRDVRVRNVEAINSDWNRVHPDDEVWKSMDSGGKVLVICNNFNFCNDMTQENMERLILGRCKPGTLVLSYSTCFASRGEATTLIWSKRFTFPRDHFSWAATDKVVHLTIHELNDNTDTTRHSHTKRVCTM